MASSSFSVSFSSSSSSRHRCSTASYLHHSSSSLDDDHHHHHLPHNPPSHLGDENIPPLRSTPPIPSSSSSASPAPSPLRTTGTCNASANCTRDLLLDNTDAGVQALAPAEDANLGARSARHYTASVDLLSDLQVEEDCALRLSEQTTKTVYNCVKVAEDMKTEATRTVSNLHQQGEKMFHTHRLAVDMDRSLTAGEKLLGSLGGIFSRTWRPRRGPALRGPVVEASSYHVQRNDTLLLQQQRTDLHLHVDKDHHRSASSCGDSRVTSTLQGPLEMERRKQDDALADLSNILDQLKDMTTDMGHEISRQNASLENFLNDTTVLEGRVKNANAWGRRLLGKR